MESVILFGPKGEQYRWQASGRAVPADLGQQLASDVPMMVRVMVPVRFGNSVQQPLACNCKPNDVRFYGPASVGHEPSCPCYKRLQMHGGRWA